MRRLRAAAALVLALAAASGCSAESPAAPETPAPAAPAAGEPPAPAGRAVAIFAGGCFWCMEPPFDAQDGVLATISGYTGGSVEAPSYEQVSAGETGHFEAVEVVYDPARVSYARLLELFWRNVDPIDGGGQFCDRGPQYRSAIFVRDDAQRAAAEASRRELEASGRLPAPIATEILPAARFWPAEEYHQDFYLRNPLRYRYYRHGCGRDRRLEVVWGSAPAH
jgi:peptide-methionine (S)-S-oxide reductase